MKESKEQLDANGSYSLISSYFAAIRPIDLLRWTEEKYVDDNGEDQFSYRRVSDVTLLLNSERIINQLGEESYRHMVASMSMPSNRYENGKYDDDALLKTVKPRYCQTASELSAWVDSIVDDGRAIIDREMTRRKEAEEAALAKKAAEMAEKAKANIPKLETE